jgi:RNase P subunit RPR2
MKILKSPEPHLFKRKTSCKRCSTRVLLEIKDLTMYSDQRDGMRFEWSCPTCGRLNYEDADFVSRELSYAVKRVSS